LDFSAQNKLSSIYEEEEKRVHHLPNFQTSEAMENKMKFVKSGQEAKYLISYFWNWARIKTDILKSLSLQ
jgi:hypothetical protein